MAAFWVRGLATFVRCAPPTNGTFGLTRYANPTGNWNAHFRMTAPAITRAFPQLDVLFIGAGTTGTLMGCARYLREWPRRVRVVAVDSVGSVTFGGPAGRRMIPGLGAAVPPPQFDKSFVDEFVLVEEADTIRTCRRMGKHGFLFGGSTGTVVFAAINWLKQHNAKDLTAVAISPDLGERYVDTIYNNEWVQTHFGNDFEKGVRFDFPAAKPAAAWSNRIDEAADLIRCLRIASPPSFKCSLQRPTDDKLRRSLPPDAR